MPLLVGIQREERANRSGKEEMEKAEQVELVATETPTSGMAVPAWMSYGGDVRSQFLPDVTFSSESAEFEAGLFPKAGVEKRRRVAALRLSPAASFAFTGVRRRYSKQEIREGSR